MEIIAERAMVKTDAGVIECKVVLARISGGQQIQYIGFEGNVLKTEKLSRSPYRFQVDPEKYKK